MVDNIPTVILTGRLSLLSGDGMDKRQADLIDEFNSLHGEDVIDLMYTRCSEYRPNATRDEMYSHILDDKFSVSSLFTWSDTEEDWSYWSKISAEGAAYYTDNRDRYPFCATAVDTSSDSDLALHGRSERYISADGYGIDVMNAETLRQLRDRMERESQWYGYDGLLPPPPPTPQFTPIGNASDIAYDEDNYDRR